MVETSVYKLSQNKKYSALGFKAEQIYFSVVCRVSDENDD